MPTWTAQQLDTIGAADEVDVAPGHPDGSPGRATTIWVVRLGDDLYVRSYRGRAARWFQRALRQREGRLAAAGVDHDITFEVPTCAAHQAIDAAYRRKYARYSDSYVGPMVSPTATAATLRLVPR